MAEARRSMLVGLVAPVLLAALVAAAIGALVGQVLVDPATLRVSLVVAWAIFAAGRAFAFVDKPKGVGGVVGEVATGVALGVAAAAVLSSFFDLETHWALLAGTGLGIARAHKPLMRRVRDAGPRDRLVLGFLDPREGVALGVLLAGYALLGVSLWRLHADFGRFLPESGKLLAIGGALYALYGAKLLLGFASHDAAAREAGFVAWLRANLLRNAIVLVLLVAYVAYRDDLAGSVPFYPLIEFALGMAVFGFVLARLRSRLRRDRAEHATASVARPHRQRVDTLTEGEYEAVSRPVSRFLETGRGLADYEATVREAARLDGPQADAALAPIRAWREPPESPPLPLAWGVAASVAGGLALAIGVVVLVLGFAPEEVPLALQLASATLGLSVYRAQDAARAHRQPWRAVALAGAGSAFLLGGAAPLATRLPLGLVHGGLGWLTLLLAALALAGIPALLSWRQARRLASGEGAAPLPSELPSEVLDRSMRASRKRAGVAAVAAIVILLLVPFLVKWLAKRAIVPPDFAEVYNDVAGAALWVLVAVGASAVARFAGLSRARPAVVADERRRRAGRLALHSSVMRRLERV
ncbi:MAG TPA: hypothetical protein VHH36_01680 [Candidatus Thermoplasmatota archaeon]|nr:hypothetical protein [Candidatus Thermoplasmatota archaeon]